jgi:hypothetical protein
MTPLCRRALLLFILSSRVSQGRVKASNDARGQRLTELCIKRSGGGTIHSLSTCYIYTCQQRVMRAWMEDYYLQVGDFVAQKEQGLQRNGVRSGNVG